VAFAAIILYREGILTLVVAGAAGFAVSHFRHGCFLYSCLIGECLRVAINAFVDLKMVFVAECHITGFRPKGDFGGFISLVTFVAVTG